MTSRVDCELRNWWPTASVLLCAAISACAPRAVVHAGESRGVDSDAFEAVAREAYAKGTGVPIGIDARPIWVDDKRLTIDRSSLVSVPESIVNERVRLLRQLGIQAVDATAIGLNDKCPSALAGAVPADSTAAGSHAFDHCPGERLIVYGVGTARRGEGVTTESDLYDVGRQSARQGYWAVRVARSNVGPLGADLQVFDYVVACVTDGCHVLKVIPLYVVE